MYIWGMAECVPDFHTERGKNFCFNLNENQKVKTRQYSTIVKYVSKMLFDPQIDILQHFSKSFMYVNYGKMCSRFSY